MTRPPFAAEQVQWTTDGRVAFRLGPEADRRDRPASPPDETQRAEALTHMGPAALPALAERFPGPVTLGPFSPDAELPPFAKCGPRLSVLERPGERAERLRDEARQRWIDGWSKQN